MRIRDRLERGMFDSGETSAANIWTPRGTVLDASESYETLQCQEPNVIFDVGAQVIATAEPVFKMWYSSGVGKISYAESLTGLPNTWVKYTLNPVVADHTRAHAMKVGETYVMFAHGVGGLNKLTSTDGISWSVAATGVLASGGASDWDDTINNVFVWIEGSTWYMLYEGNLGAGVYKAGLATSVNDGVTFTKSSSNPVISGTGSVSHAWLRKVGATYYSYFHVTTSSVLPTDGAKYKSTNLINWTRHPSGLAFPRTAPNEGAGSAAGQVADIHLLEVNGVTYMYYTAMIDGSQPTGHINVATANLPLDDVMRSLDGMAMGYYPELLLNPGFERPGAGGTDVFASWIEAVGDGAIVTTSAAGEHKYDASAVKLTAGTARNTSVRQALVWTLFVPGATYRLTGWHRGDGTNAGMVRVFAGVDMIPFVSLSNVTTTFQQFTADFVYSGSSTVTIYCYCPNAAGGVAYFDGLSLKRIL
jgi:hypothetical protein